MKKRMLAMLLCLTMVLSLLPMVALAAEEDVLYVGGTNVIAGGYWKGDGAGGLTEGSESDYTVRYEPDTRTLTLCNAAISKAHLERTITETTVSRWNEDLTEANIETGYLEEIEMCGIYSSVELNLCLEGTNTISLDATDTSISEAPTDRDFVHIDLDSHGIYVCKKSYVELDDGSGFMDTELLPITISGSGSCAVSAGEINAKGMMRVYSCGLYAKGLTVNGGELTFSGANAVGAEEDPTLEMGSGNVYTTGIGNGNGNITINSGSVVALGGTAQGGSETISCGITYSRVTMNGGSLTARGGSIPESGSSFGIYEGNVTLNGGVVKAFGGTVTTGETAGILTGGSSMGGSVDIKINAGTLIAAAGEYENAEYSEKYAVQYWSTTITPPEDYWWRTAETDDYTNGSETAFTLAEDQTYVEITSVDPTPVPDPAPQYTVSVINGSSSSGLAEAGTTVTITAAEKDGYTFKNWEVLSGAITLSNANEKVTTFIMPEENVTVKAVFAENESTDSGDGEADATTAWQVSAVSAKHGSVSVSPSTAKQGDSVTITVTPDTGYQLDKIIAVGASGTAIALTDQGNGTYTFTMPDSNVMVSASFAALEVPVTFLPFTDVTASDWFYEGVAYAYHNGLMTGTSATTFSPNGTTTRGMIVTILHRLEGCPAAEASGFTDVESGLWYQDAVDWAAANGIVNGTSETTFAPTAPITREQMAAILYRYAAYKGYDVSQLADLSRFSDASDVSTYASDALAWANAAGLITGVTDTSLAPQGSAIRAQAATILMRFCEGTAQ